MGFLTSLLWVWYKTIRNQFIPVALSCWNKVDGTDELGVLDQPKFDFMNSFFSSSLHPRDIVTDGDDYAGRASFVRVR